MIFNKHSYLEGQHAFLSPSKYHWIRYSEEKLDLTYSTRQAAQRGSELHDFAMNAVRLGIKLPRSRKTLNLYVNDAIGFRMNVEQPLFYSFNCFGTADAISFRNNLLRIHDLKTGETRCSMDQLCIYAAIFCLEYDHRPDEIEIELRIYKSDEVEVFTPDPEYIHEIMVKIVAFDKRIDNLRRVGE